MRESLTKSSALMILAIIVGGVGLGLGAFAATVNLTGGADGDNGDDGDDGITTTIITYDNVIEYPCSSEVDINNALTAIGTGYGIITITSDLTISSPISINGGGNYIIQEAGAIIKCGGDIAAFEITDAISLTIQNIKINASKIETSYKDIVDIEEVNDNPIYLKNVHIFGDSDKKGHGIRIDSENVWISNCYFNDIRTAIRQYSNNSHIYDNFFKDFILDGIAIFAAYSFIDGNYINNARCGIIVGIDGENNIVSNNIVENVSDYGIAVQSSFNTVENNRVRFFGDIGLQAFGDYNIFTGNWITNNTSVTGSDYGIFVEGDYNVIDTNACYNCVIPQGGGSIGYGIFINGGSYNSTVVGNTCLFNENNLKDFGTDTFLSGNQYF